MNAKRRKCGVNTRGKCNHHAAAWRIQPCHVAGTPTSSPPSPSSRLYIGTAELLGTFFQLLFPSQTFGQRMVYLQLVQHHRQAAVQPRQSAGPAKSINLRSVHEIVSFMGSVRPSAVRVRERFKFYSNMERKHVGRSKNLQATYARTLAVRLPFDQ